MNTRRNNRSYSIWGKLKTIQILAVATCIWKCCKLVEARSLQALKAQLVCHSLVQQLTSIIKSLYFIGGSILWALRCLIISHELSPSSFLNLPISTHLGISLTTCNLEYTNFCRMRISLGFECNHSGWFSTCSGFSITIDPIISQGKCNNRYPILPKNPARQGCVSIRLLQLATWKPSNSLNWKGVVILRWMCN